MYSGTLAGTVRHGAKPSLTTKEERQVQFPIYEDGDDFEANRERRLPGILDFHDGIVRRYQPYQRRADPSSHPFAVLRDLSNGDKHQNIHLTFWCASKATFSVTSRSPGCLITQMVGLLDLNDPLETGRPLFTVTVASERSQCKGMQVESRFVYQAALEDGSWVYDTTRPIERLVAELIDEIARVL